MGRSKRGQQAMRYFSTSGFRLSLTALLLGCSFALPAQEYLTPEFRSFSPGALGGSTAGEYGYDELDPAHQRYDGNPWRVTGGLRINPFVALELGYREFGHDYAAGQDVMDPSGWSLSGLLSVPLTQRISPYARVGQLFRESDGRAMVPSSSSDSRDMYYGIGLRFGLAEQLDLNFEYERYGVEEMDLDMGTMNLHFNF